MYNDLKIEEGRENGVQEHVAANFRISRTEYKFCVFKGSTNQTLTTVNFAGSLHSIQKHSPPEQSPHVG